MSIRYYFHGTCSVCVVDEIVPGEYKGTKVLSKVDLQGCTKNEVFH